MAKPDLVVVWGNCQAAPLADLMRGPLDRAGLTVVDVPPVYLATEDEIADVHRLVRRAAFLVSNPVREEYRFAGSGTRALAAELPVGGRLVTVASVYHVGPFPFLVNAHGADGARVDAPVTVYHDLRAVLAASRGMTLEQTLRWWPEPESDAVRAIDRESHRELRDRQRDLDVPVDDLVGRPGALWSMNHPDNKTLAEIARRLLREMEVGEQLVVPGREYLGERRAPVTASVTDALGWPAQATRSTWVVQGAAVANEEFVARHLEFYATRPGVVRDSMHRHADRVRHLVRE